MNGSFTTDKRDPGDLDLVVELYINDPEDLHAPALQGVLRLLSGPHAKPHYACDAYPLPVLPPSSPHYAKVTEQGRAYWEKWFGRDRSGRPKGKVRATTGGLP